MLPKTWLEYMAKAEQDIKRRPADAPKKPRATGRLESPRMRRAQTGTRNTVKAIYDTPNGYNQAQVIDPKTTTFTTNLGGNCEPDGAHGKDTRSRS
jgi:hypothetical protein